MSTAEHNLLLGLTALQTDFIDRNMLVEALLVWKTDKQRTVLEILQQQKRLDARQVELLENLAQEHIRRSGGTAEQGLIALSTFSTVLPLVDQVDDPDIYATIDVVKASRLATRQPSDNDFASTVLGQAIGSGLTDQQLDQQLSQAWKATRTSALASEGRSRFRVLRMHARGGLGEVYLAEDGELHRNVALKEIISKYADLPENRQRFMVEAEITGRLQHPGIVPVYGLGIYPDGRPFYAMRFVEGDNLLTAIRSFHHQAKGKPWTGDLMVAFRELLGRFMDVCDAMQFAHQRHVLHRDLKPHNIMLGEYGETLVVDWGLAKPLYEGQAPADAPESAIIPVSGSASGSEREGSILGTPDYMPPEQAAGRLSQLSVRSDIYSLGATLFHLLTNQPPFQGKSDNTLNRGPNTQPPKKRLSVDQLLQKVQAGEFESPHIINPQVGRALSAICKKAMALRPEDRYESARELKTEIQRWLADEPVRAVPEHWHDKIYRWFRRHRQLSLMGGAALAVIAVVSVFAAIAVNNSRNRAIRAGNISLFSAQLDGLLAQYQSGDLPLDQQFFSGAFDPIHKRLELLDEPSASRYEVRALKDAAENIRTRLTASTPTEDAIRKISSDIDYWSQRRLALGDDEQFTETEGNLRQLLDNRRASWNKLQPLVGRSLAAAFMIPESFKLSATQQLTLASTPNRHVFHQLSVGNLPEGLNHEINVRFTQQSLDQPAVAIALNPQESNPAELQYQAILCVEKFKPNVWSRVALSGLETLADAARQGRPVRLLLARGRTVLNEDAVNVGLGEFTLSLRREDDKLRAMVNPVVGRPGQILFEDFLTLPHGSLPGIWFGPNTEVSAIELAYKTRPLELSPMESIKSLINAQKFEDAIEQLSALTGSEADYLRSLCMPQVKDRLEMLELVLAKAPRVDSSGVVLDRWHLPALLDAIRLNREEENEERFRELILILKFYYGTSIEDVAVRMPEDMRESLIKELRKMGGRWRISTQAENDTPMLDTAVHLDSVLETDDVMKRATRWRRCDGLRVTGNHKDAVTELKKLLGESLADSTAPPGEAANLLTDVCWVLFAHNRLNEVEIFLAELQTRDDLPADAESSIQLENARLAVHQNRLGDAAKILDKLLENESRLRVSQHIDACFVAGFIQADLGNAEAAQQYWKRGMFYGGKPVQQSNFRAAELHGTEAVEHQCIVTIYGTLASLTNSFTGEAAKESFDAQMPNDGISGSTAIDIVESMFTLDFIEDLANATYRSQRGTAVARRRAYHIHDLGPYFNEPIRLLVFEGVVVKHFKDYRDNDALMEDAWNACDQLFLTYDAGGINEQEDMRLIVTLWAGQAGLETWQIIEPKVTRDVAAGLALLAGKAHVAEAKSASTEALRIMHFRNARTMLEVARDHGGATENFVKLADELLAELPKNE